LVDHCWIC